MKIVCLIVVILLLYARIYVTYNNRIAIIRAISNYKRNVIENHYFGDGTKPSYLVEYDDMESYFETLIRFWDFSPKHILYNGKYEIIKDYMKGEGK